MRKIGTAAVLATVALISLYLQSFTLENTYTIPYEGTGNMMPKLSDYGVYQGIATELVPAEGYIVYELASGAFTDYALKQRLVKVPYGSRLTGLHDGLPEFPEGTVLVKTFYYDNETDTAGRKLIETRVMIKSGGKWDAGTYQWDARQTDAFLVKKSKKVPVSFTDQQGRTKAINYEIPGAGECAKCHKNNGNFLPIGLKIRNLNRDIVRNSATVNQLQHLNNAGVLSSKDAASYTRFPDYRDKSLPLEDRARAYLDINCGFCHSDGGFCSLLNIIRLRLDYETPFEKTLIAKKIHKIDKLMANGRMPYTGTTIIDEEGLKLVQDYLKTLKNKS